MDTYDYYLENTRDKIMRWLEEIDNDSHRFMRQILREGEITQQDYWNFEENFNATMNGYYNRARMAKDVMDLILLKLDVLIEIEAANE